MDGLIGETSEMRWNCLFDLIKSQVLEYDGSAWTEKGRMERGRGDHAVVEANLLAICPAGKGKSQFSLKEEQVYVKLDFCLLCETQIRQI